MSITQNSERSWLRILIKLMYIIRISNKLNLPSDLFRFYIPLDIYKDATIKIFIEFVQNILARKGWYFNSHFMHEVLNVGDIYIRFVQLDKLIPYINVLKEVKVYNDLYFGKDKLCQPSLIDKFIVNTSEITKYGVIQKDISFICKDYLSKSDDLPRRIDFFSGNNSINISKDYKRGPKKDLRINILHLSGSSEDDFETLTNTNFLVNRIKLLRYKFLNLHSLTNKTLLNILEYISI